MLELFHIICLDILFVFRYNLFYTMQSVNIYIYIVLHTIVQSLSFKLHSNISLPPYLSSFCVKNVFQMQGSF